MKRPTDRRTVLVIAGAAAVAATAGLAAAQRAEIPGEATFAGGGTIPKGHLVITVEDSAVQDSGQRRAAASTRVESDGKSTAIAFFVPSPASATALPTLRIVARLERSDGWLLARGSASFEPGQPVHVTLNTVMY